MRHLIVLGALCFALPAHAVTIDWVTVGDPGNACDVQPPYPPRPGGCFGSVDYVYRIAKYETTNAQYAEFLNAVATTDTNGLYHENMADTSSWGGITRSGSSGSYTYSAISGRENMPVDWVSFYDALRFANWLHNGQGSGDTETGAYTITVQGIADNSITRNAGATIFLPSEDEWYKAAYFDRTSYFDYPAGTDAQTFCSDPVNDTGNSANCGPRAHPGNLTNVGIYSLSGSPYGTFDQGGNVWEWSEAIILDSSRGHRGGSGDTPRYTLEAWVRGAVDPTYESYSSGFRVAMIPEPSTALLLACGLAGLAAAGRRRSLQ